MLNPIWVDGVRLADDNGQPLWAERGPVEISSRRPPQRTDEGNDDIFFPDDEEAARRRADARKRDRQRQQ